MPDYSVMKTESLIDELERLKHRVRDRDYRMGQRLKNPMGNPHPQQFWPLCSEAHKVTYMNHMMYFRWYDWPAILTFPVVTCVSFRYMVQFGMNLPQYYRFNPMYARNLGPAAFFSTLFGYTTKCELVMARMFGLDENSLEISKFGPMYPEEIDEAARRKEKYEQEYIRIKEGLFNFGKVAERVDVVNSHFFEVAAPGTSGYFAQEKVKQDKIREMQEAGAAQREARGA